MRKILVPLSAALLCAACTTARPVADSRDVPGAARKPAQSLLEIVCKNDRGFSFTKDYREAYLQGVKMTLKANGESREFPYFSEQRPMGVVGVTMWVAKDGSYLEEREMSASTPPAGFRFAIFFDAKTGKTTTTFVRCEEKTGAIETPDVPAIGGGGG